LRELVVGILIVEDLIAILLMAALTALASGEGLSASSLASTTGRLAGFLIGLLVVGMLVIPRAMRMIVRLGRPETTLVASIGVCFASALLAQRFGYSVALGAFLAGSLVAESGEAPVVEHLVEPVRDMFAAVFFVSVGMTIDPGLIATHWVAITVLTVVVIVGKIVSVAFGAFLTGNGTRKSIQAGMSLAQIGEFSFIIASLGLSLKATGEFLYPVAVAVSAVTTLTTPWLIRGADPVAKFVDRHLPKPLQTFASLYGSWLEQMRTRSRSRTGDQSGIRSLLGLLLLDAAVLTALIIGASLSARAIGAWIRATIGVDIAVARALVVGTAVLLAVPFCVGIARLAQRLGVTLAEMALPGVPDDRVDMAAAPRRALVVTLQLGVALLIGTPLVALTQPFLPGVPTALLLTVVLLGLSVAFWRSASNLQGHARAGAQVIVEALASQSRANSASDAAALLELHQLLPGLGELVPVRLAPGSPVVGSSLAQLNLRGLTGATVLAITRGGQGLLIPTAHEILEADDVVVLTGDHDAVEAATGLLTRG
jgi:monovalent cation:H+ antiporter-2, CPA2 family